MCAKFCLDIGDGASAVERPEGMHPAAVFLPQRLVQPPGTSVLDLVQWVFQGISEVHASTYEHQIRFFAERAIITPTNSAASDINDAVLARLAGKNNEILQC